MADKYTIEIEHNGEDNKISLSTHAIAKGIRKEQLAYFLECHCNSFQTEYSNGQEIGKLLQNSHRTLQATVVRFLLGIVSGIGLGVDMRFTDARNETAIKCSHKISQMIEDGELTIGYMI